MKVRTKHGHYEGHASRFNIHALSEVLVVFADGSGDSVYTADLEVELPTGWKDMNKAFKDGDIITDNYNTFFFTPANEADRERGFTLS